MEQKWVAIHGPINIKDGTFRFEPVLNSGLGAPGAPDATGTSNYPPHGLARSNISFEQGSVSFEIKVSDAAATVAIGLQATPDGEVYAGVNSLGALYGFGVFRNSAWEPAGGTGTGGTLETDEWHLVKVVVHGSNLDLHFDDVKVVSASKQVQSGELTLLMQSWKSIEIRNFKIERRLPICFIAMQFTPEFNSLYQQVIKPTCEEFDYEVIRADDFYTNGLIIEDILRSIRTASLIIADVTPNNPNVYYEVGFAHGIGKTTILLSDRNREKLPFDISGFRTLFYENSIGGKSEVEARLRLHLQAIKSAAVR